MIEQNRILETLKRYAKNRVYACEKGNESPELSALLVEKYAIGMVDAIRTLQHDIDINLIASKANQLCRSIDPNTEENRKLRYNRVAKLDLSQARFT